NAGDVVADVGQDSGSVEAIRDTLSARRERAIQFADDRFLAHHAGANMTGGQEHTADISLARHYPVATDFVGQDVFVSKSVLQRHHDGLRSDNGRGGAYGVTRVVGFDEYDNQIGNRAEIGSACAGAN